MHIIARSSFKSIILLLLIALGTLFFRLGSLPLSGADEPRYARIAEEMYEQGNWITPTLEGRPWLEKPPLYYWITIPLYTLLGSSETTARIAPALFALMSALAILWLGSLLWSRLAGLLGSLILLTSLGFVGFARSASTDMPLTGCFTAAMAILTAAAVKANFSTWKVLCSYIFIGLAILAKGPVAVVLAVGIGLLFWCLDERGVSLRLWRVVPGLVLAAAISLPWFLLAFQQNGFAFISTFFINHNIARYLTNIHHHSQPFYYYLPVLLALFFPWSGWVVLLFPRSLVEEFRRWRQWHPAKLFLSCWFVFPLLFFTLSDSKLAGYILPSLPPLALLLGIRLSNWFERPVEQSRLRIVVKIHLIFAAGMAAAAVIFFQKDYGGNWGTGLLLSAAIMIPAFFALIFGLRGNWIRSFQAVLIQGLLLVMTVAQFAFPILGTYHSTRDIAGQALELRQEKELIVTYRFFHHSLNYYTEYQVADEFNDWESLDRFARKHPHLLVITEAPYVQDILKLQKFSISLLDEQGDLRLLRLVPK